MQIYLDISPVTADPTKRTGLARSALQLARSLANIPELGLTLGGFGSLSASWNVARMLETDSLCKSANWAPLSRLQSLFPLLSESPSKQSRNLGRLINLLRNPMAGLNEKSFDLMHSTYARFPWRTRIRRGKKLLTVHDLIPLILPAKYFPKEQLGITSRIIHSLSRSDYVVCPSQATKKDLVDYLGFPEERVSVIPWGVDNELFRPQYDELLLRKLDLAHGRYFVTLSSQAPHKNIPFLIECFHAAMGAANARDFKLVLLGGANDSKILCDRAGSVNRSSVLSLGYVTDANLPAILSSAAAFCFPSLYEGFGLPVLEAMACGTSVIVGNKGSLPEVAGSVGRCIDPEDRDGWIEELASRMNVVSPVFDYASLAHSETYRWAATALDHVRLYKRIISEI